MERIPLVTFIIINWNGDNFVQDCIHSILKQTYKNIEIIVVDNGSTDYSPILIERMTHYIPNLHLIKNDKNVGFAAACNIGIKRASGDFIVCINNDAILDQNWLTEVIKEVLYSKEIAIASGPIFYYMDPSLIWSFGAKFDCVSGFSWNLGQKEYFFQTEEIDYLSGCVMLIRKECLSKIGLFDEKFFLYDDDIDICFRAKYKGYHLAFVPKALAWHRVSEGKKKMPYKVYYYKMRSDLRFCFKHLDVQYILSSLFFHVISYIADMLFFRRNPLYFLFAIKAFLWNLINLHETFRARAIVRYKALWKPKNRWNEFINVVKDRLIRHETFW
jgi:GT2 family glycosyltransferase